MPSVHLLSKSLLFVGVVAVTGCSAPEPLDNVVVAENPETFNYVTSLQRSASTPVVYDNAGYFIVFDDDAYEANLTISNLVVEKDQRPLTLTFDGVPMDFTSDRHNTQRIIKEDVLVSDDPVNGGTTISNVTIIHSQANKLDPYGCSGLFASYCVDNRYLVVSFPYNLFLVGTTRISTSSVTQFDYNPTYRIALNPDAMTATLRISNLKIGDYICDEFTIPQLSLELSESGFSAASDKSIDVVAGGKKATIKSVSLATHELNQLRCNMSMSIDGTIFVVDGFLTAYHTHH